MGVATSFHAEKRPILWIVTGEVHAGRRELHAADSPAAAWVEETRSRVRLLMSKV